MTPDPFLLQLLACWATWFAPMDGSMACFRGPGPVNTPGIATCCSAFDADHDGDVDLADVAAYINLRSAVMDKWDESHVVLPWPEVPSEPLISKVRSPYGACSLPQGADKD